MSENVQESLARIQTTTMSSTTTPPDPLSITVHTAATKPNIYSWSPFDIKLEARLRFSQRAYTVQKGFPAKGPRGKVPYVRIGPDVKDKDPKRNSADAGNGSGREGRGKEEEGLVMGDSTLITRKLIEMGELEDLNGSLSPVQKAQDLMLRALLEQKIYFIMVSPPNLFSSFPASLPHPPTLALTSLLTPNRDTSAGSHDRTTSIPETPGPSPKFGIPYAS